MNLIQSKKVNFTYNDVCDAMVHYARNNGLITDEESLIFPAHDLVVKDSKGILIEVYLED